MHVLQAGEVPEALLTDISDVMRARGTLGVIETGDEQAEAMLDGAWRVSGAQESVSELLDLLAPRCDFCIVRDAAVDRETQLHVTDGLVRTGLLEESQPIDDVDPAAIVNALEDTEPYVTLESLVTAVKDHPDQDRSGAIATFTGRVREKEDDSDTPTEYLEFEQYGEIAHQELERIRQELLERPDVFEVRLHHRSGIMHAGEDIVFVVVLAGHRDQAFRTVKDGINRLKAEVPIFKKEVTVDEEFWVHNRP